MDSPIVTIIYRKLLWLMRKKKATLFFGRTNVGSFGSFGTFGTFGTFWPNWDFVRTMIVSTEFHLIS